MRKVLILCTGISARSQIAEALLRRQAGDRFEVFSAGTHPTELGAEAVAVMREIGVDLSGERSKTLDEFTGWQFDYVITVCDHAKEFCPIFPGRAKHLHWSVEDPAAVQGPEEERQAAFRKVRDEISARLTNFVAEHGLIGYAATG